MKRRGFTLIELLATILILAVVALITIPIVQNVLNDVQKSKFKQNAKSLLNLVKLERDNKNMMGDDEIAVYNIDSSYGNVFFNEELIEEDFNGEIDGSGIIIVNKDGDMAISYSNGKWCAYKPYHNNDVTITKGECGLSSKLSCEDLGIEILNEGRWSQYKIIKTNSNSVTCTGAKYKLNDGEIYDLSDGLVVTDDNTSLKVYTNSIYGVEKEESYLIDKIDLTPPEKVVLSAVLRSNSVELSVNASDSESGIAAYAYSIDGGQNWTNYQKDSKTIFKNLVPGTYDVKVKAFNGTFGSINATEKLGATESNTVTVVVLSCPTPTLTMTPLLNVYSQAKVVSIHYENNSNCTGSYSIDDGATWNEGNKVVLYQPGTKLIAKNIENKTNETNTVTYDIDTIDRTAPTEVNVSYSSSSPRTLTVVASGVDSESGIYGYRFSSDGGKTYSNLQTSPIYTFTDLLEENYNIRVKAYNMAWFNTKDLVLDNGENVENEEIGSTESAIKPMKLADCPAPSITVSPSGDVWAASKKVTINYDSTVECPVRKYSIDGETWIELEEGQNSKSITLDKNTNVATYQGVTNTRGTNYQKYIDKIDSVVPQASFSVTTGTNYYYSSILRMNLGCSAGASGITKYTVTVAGSPRIVSVNSSSVTYTVTEVDGKEVVTSTASGTDSFYPRNYRSTSGDINISVTCTNGAGISSPAQTSRIYYTAPTNTPSPIPSPTKTPTPVANQCQKDCASRIQASCESGKSSCSSACSSAPAGTCSCNWTCSYDPYSSTCIDECKATPTPESGNSGGYSGYTGPTGPSFYYGVEYGGWQTVYYSPDGGRTFEANGSYYNPSTGEYSNERPDSWG